MDLTLDELRDELIKKLREKKPDAEFVFVLRETDEDKHTISTSYKADSHFGLIHMITKACRAWEDVNTTRIVQDPINMIPPAKFDPPTKLPPPDEPPQLPPSEW